MEHGKTFNFAVFEQFAERRKKTSNVIKLYQQRETNTNYAYRNKLISGFHGGFQ